MLFRKNIDVNGTASTEVLETALVGQPNVPRTIKGVFVTEDTSTLVRRANIRVYLDQLQIVDLPYEHFCSDSDNDDAYIPRYVPLDLELQSGETLKVGSLSGSSAFDCLITVEYDEKRGNR